MWALSRVYYKTCLDPTPKHFATESLGAPTLWHRMFRTILEMDTIFSWQRLWKDCEKGHFLWKKSRVELTFCCPCVLKKSLGHTRHRPTRWFFVERKHQISRANPTPTWRPRASASSQDWWPINGAPFPGQESLISAPFSSDFMAITQGISMSGIQKRLWTLVNWQSKHAIFVVRNGKNSGTQTGRNDDVFFSSIPSSWLECRLLSQ